MNGYKKYVDLFSYEYKMKINQRQYISVPLAAIKLPLPLWDSEYGVHYILSQRWNENLKCSTNSDHDCFLTFQFWKLFDIKFDFNASGNISGNKNDSFSMKYISVNQISYHVPRLFEWNSGFPTQSVLFLNVVSVELHILCSTLIQYCEPFQ